MPELQVRSKTWPGALRELQAYYRGNSQTTRKILHWLTYTWLPRCQVNSHERVRIEQDYQSGKIPLEEHDRLMSQFEDKFHRKELMDSIGLDFYNRNDYHHVSRFFRNERELTAHVLERFTQEAKWRDLKERMEKREISMEEVWWAFIQSCLSWNVFPVYADPDDGNYHKLLTFADWRSLFENFRTRVKSELETKAGLVYAIEAGGRGLPAAQALNPLPLPANPFLSLPDPRVCPDCNMPFTSDGELVSHHRQSHP